MEDDQEKRVQADVLGHRNWQGIGAITAIVALLMALLAWLWPRQPNALDSNPFPSTTAAQIQLRCFPGYRDLPDLKWADTNGGPMQDGCVGRTTRINTTGTSDYDAVAEWYFDALVPGAPCGVDAYIADTADSSGRALYLVDDQRQDDEGNAEVAQAQVDQNAARGTWAHLGTWPAPADGHLTVSLTNPSDVAGHQYPITASAIRVSCQQ